MQNNFDASWTADQVMKAYPATIPVFLTLKLDCVGCYLERFCSLEEVAASYKLSLDVLLEKLRQAL